MRVEDQYLDVLQNIESGIVCSYREHPELCDHDVIRVLEAVMDGYKAEKIGRAPRDVSLSPAEREMFEAVRGMCEWRLGRGNPLLPVVGPAEEPESKTVDEILLCLKRIHKSAQGWNRELGTHGYLNFVVQYIP